MRCSSTRYLTDAQDGGECLGSRSHRLTSSRDHTLPTEQGLIEPQGWYKRIGEEKNILSLLEIEPFLLGRGPNFCLDDVINSHICYC
jgi:hypothetical protein